MVKHFSDYGIYLILAYGLTTVIAIFLLLFAVSAKFHRLLFKLVGVFNRSGKLDGVMEVLRKNCDIMEVSTADLLSCLLYTSRCV